MMANFIKPIKVFYLLCSTLLLLLWLEQGSINAYWMQTYHKNSPLAQLDNQTFWSEGEALSNTVELHFDSFKNWFDQLNEQGVDFINDQFTQNKHTEEIPNEESELTDKNLELTINIQLIFQNKLPQDKLQKSFLFFSEKPIFSREMLLVDTKSLTKPLSKNAIQQVSNHLFLLEKGQKVFFVGDSLMQGVAPHVMRQLKKEHKIESINLSKQSTGLAYPHIFNWPKLANDTFEANPDIRLMVVFMGPNDPWPFPVIRGYPHFKFNSPEWEGVYRARIQKLINAATKHNAKVLWIGAPNVKDPKLNTGIIRLNHIYKSQVIIAQQQYIPSNDILGMPDHNFVKFIQIPNKGNVALRTNDGIHFTTIGQKRIADKILSLLRFNDTEELKHNE